MMGLSEEERVRGLYYAVNKMVEIKDNMSECDHYVVGKICGFLDNLWYTLLKGNANGIHWIVGSSGTQTKLSYDTMTPWAIGVHHQIKELINREKPDLLHRLDADGPFDAFEGHINISGLLRSPFDKIHELFCWTEQCAYYLRRYRDDLLNSFKDLDKLIADIQGECFRHFKRDQEYAIAYMSHSIFKDLYGNKYPYQTKGDDVILDWMHENHIHHNLSAAVKSNGFAKAIWIMQQHRRLEQSKVKMTNFERVALLLEFAGKHFDYKRAFDDLIKVIKQKKLCSTKEIKVLQNIFAKNSKEEKSKKEHESSFYSIYDVC